MTSFGPMAAAPGFGATTNMGGAAGIGLASGQRTVGVAAGSAMATVLEPARQQAAATLQRVYRWLEAAVPMAPETAVLVPVVVTAVHLYEAQQYEASITQAMTVVQTARALRSVAPALPPL
ncbi:hypothetical protein [Pilimelia columellifera]|uniref:Uncharacterized protein n=1 Tax=Pilimelia columellifera subsp. columellifera TaxID=706583 RepID=A0ABN3NJL9_9ACTN